MIRTLKAQELDTVRLLEDLPEYGLHRGDVGVVLEAYSEPEEAYDLEFVEESGTESRFAYSVKPSQFENTDSEAREAYERGMTFLMEDNLLEASRELKRAIKLRESYRGGILKSILASFEKNKEEDLDTLAYCLRFLTELAPDYELARVNLAVAILNLGVHKARQGNLDDAIELYQRALAVKSLPEVVVKVQENIAAAFNEIALREYRKGNLPRAHAGMRMACMYFPSDSLRRNLAVMCVHLARFYMAAGNFTAAIKFFEEAEEAGLVLPELLNDYAIASIFIGRKEQAIRAFERALDLTPDDVLIRENLSRVMNDEPARDFNSEEISIDFDFIPPPAATQYQFAA